jgi:predicted LPLAT superfamily acyltransferase
LKALRELRSSEWLLIGYFSYVALISASRLPALLLFLVVALVAVLAYGESRASQKFFSIMRDWIPLALTLVAYREMDWFTPLGGITTWSSDGWSGTAPSSINGVSSVPSNR